MFNIDDYDNSNGLDVKILNNALLVRSDGYVKNVSGHHNSNVEWHQGFENQGYRCVKFPKTRKNMLIHRLVALSFIDNPNGLDCVDHIDGDTKNNDVSNLRWVSHQTNHLNRHIHRSGKLVGCSYRSDRGVWEAKIRINGKRYFLGSFMTESEASSRYIQVYTEWSKFGKVVIGNRTIECK